MMVRGIDYIGKYSLLDVRTTKNGNTIEIPVMYTDNSREVVWYANKDPKRLKPVNVCGEKDFYMLDNRWRSFDL